MKKQDFTRKAGEITKRVIREGKVAGSADVLECVPELLSSVVMDRAYIKACIERELNRSTGNPINALLKLIGLRIVRTRSEIDNLSDTLAAEPALELRQNGGGDLDSFLRLDTELLYAGLSKMAGILTNTENERREERDAERARYDLAHGELTRAAAQSAQLSADCADMRRTVAERAQYMLSLSGPGGDGTPMAAQLMELLDDLDMTVYWDAAGAPFTEGDMFSVLKVPDLSGRRARPCVVCAGSVLAKGLRFVAEPAAQAPEAEETGE